MTKLNFLTTTEHAFFYRESNAFAKQAAISWLTVNGFENEIAELREKEDSEVLSEEVLHNTVDRVDGKHEGWFQPVEIKDGHVMYYCYQPSEGFPVYDCGDCFLTSDLVKEARRNSYNGKIYQICIDDLYTTDEFDCFEIEINGEEEYMHVSRGGYCRKTLERAVADYMASWETEERDFYTIEDDDDYTTAHISLQIAKEAGDDADWFAVGGYNDYTNWISLKNGEDCDFSHKGEVFSAILKGIEDSLDAWEDDWTEEAW